jgi:argininosuccinate lyase
VALAEGLGKGLDALSLEELRSVDARFGPEARAVFDLRSSLERRNLPGGPGGRAVRRELARWQKRLPA